VDNSLRNIHGKLPKAVSFVSSTFTSNIIAEIGADRVWAYNLDLLIVGLTVNPKPNIDSLLDHSECVSSSRMRKFGVF